MIKVEVELNDIDFDRLIDQFLPVMIEKLRQSDNPASRLISKGMPAPMAKMIIKKLPLATKEQMAADLINANKDKIAEILKQSAGQHNIRMNIGNIRAKTVSNM